MRVQDIATKDKKSRINLTPYAGRWVALVNQEVKAKAQSLPALMEQLKKKNIVEKASVMLVPRKDEGPYILAEEKGYCATMSERL